MTKTEKTVLIAVDIQHDFLPGGALGVAKGDQTIDPTLELAQKADLVVATRDWHPENHCSFTQQGGIWPSHCVQNTKGGAIEPSVEKAADIVVSKAFLAEKDAYSGFDGEILIERHPDANKIGTKDTLAHLLHQQGVSNVQISGLATDYCVKATAIDAQKAGFHTTVVKKACRPVEVESGDEEKAFGAMLQAGVEVQ